MDNFSVMVSENNNSTVVMPVASTSIDLEIFDLDEVLTMAAGDSSPCLIGAWKAFVSTLPAVVDVADGDVCSVCMEGFERQRSPDGNKRVPCGHVYHSNCITVWLQSCNSCPLCRRHFSLHRH
ncbi:uncharacterized protein LOC130713455 [Lotus japonicus]|uniref:uncharacterized protein LOC130713455 n=1 Tax=Lotus japonicus TaxID=34305 RepID=UPI002582DCC2|nr:uncharacterized protein LOC130713455 [Lotus japonicus]